MLLLRGTFRARGLQPDGDTIAFTPDDVADWKLVPGAHRLQPKADGRVAIRLEAIDALETHYGDNESGVQHQPRPLAHQATKELLTQLGFDRNFDRDDDQVETISSTTPETVPGFILTGGVDVYGRCVALVGTRPPVFNGYEIDVDVELLKKTVNYHLVKQGLVYPTFYTGFPDHLRSALTAAAREAKGATPPKGVWAKDVTRDGVKIVDMTSLTADDGAVILPKLFRRLKDYLDLKPANNSLACFPAFLGGAADKFYLQGEPNRRTGLQNIVKVSDDNIVKMTHPVEDITFDEE
ncbi:nuclease [Streptomyces sp. NBC_00091]|uniref:nuclease n=1 Tax=Streptomyces sp. NBC_00091 TaxID=2975648 RepID=UPI00225BDEDA|nr:nuclease [Streptomyces sp. NBC_00091]MCX5378718.1 nuclease [Streptomyces sp. NBC_00091]